MLRGELSSKDLPAAWKVKMRDYLGVTPDNDAAGCLQDIHWSGGAIGYFPTYTLGNLYAAQFFEQAPKDLGDLYAQFASGQLRCSPGCEKIHRHGKRFTGPQLVRHVTGKPLSAEPLMRHLRQKAQTAGRLKIQPHPRAAGAPSPGTPGEGWGEGDCERKGRWFLRGISSRIRGHLRLQITLAPALSRTTGRGS